MTNCSRPALRPFLTKLLFLVCSIVSIAGAVQAQTPQCVYVTSSTSANSFPLSTTSSNKVQWVYQPSLFTGNVIPGNITDIYLKVGSAAGASTYQNLLIKMGNVGYAAFPNGTYETGLQTVYSAATTSVPAIASGGWMKITLQTPFLFTSSSNFVIEVSQSGYTGGTTIAQASVANGRIYGPLASATGTAGAGLANFGFDVIPATPCAGKPAKPVVSGPSTVCSGVTFNLSFAPTYPFSAITYQWQASPDSLTWTNVYNFAQYSTSQTAKTYYRLIVGCTNSGLYDTSLVKKVVMDNYENCYCTPGFTNNCSTISNIKDFILNGINGTMIKDLATGCSSPAVRFVNPTPFVELLKGGMATGSINSDYTSYGQFAKIWIDFNKDGSFDATNFEQVAVISSAQNSPFSFFVPNGIDTGLYRMRVRTVYNISTFTACDVQSYGETHDYMVRIKPCANPAINLGNDTLLCGNATMTLAAPTPPSATYIWNNGSTGNTLAVTAAGKYWTKVSVPLGCSSSDTINVTTGALPALQASNDTVACLGAHVKLSAHTNGTLQWNTGAVTDTIEVNQAGAYTVKATSALGCVSRDTVRFTYGNNAIVILGPDVDACPSTQVAFNAGNPGSTYLWNNGATTQSIVTTTAGTYFVKVTTPHECEAYDSVVLTHLALPEARINYDADGILVMFGDSSLHGTSTFWDFGDGQTSHVQHPAHTYVQYGTYQVTQVSENACGRDTARVTIGLYPLGVNNYAKENLVLVYPNPTSGSFVVEDKSGAGIRSIEVLDATGRQVYYSNTPNASGKSTIQLGSVPSGLYMIRMMTAQGVIARPLNILRD